MPNVNRIGLGGQALPVRGDGKVKNERQASATAVTTDAGHAEMSDINAQLRDAPGFDAAKVEQIRTALSQGQYPLDAKRIAESFTQLESLIAGTAQHS